MVQEGDDFRNYVSKFKKTGNASQTHTWFSPTRGTISLHVPREKNDEFTNNIFEYLTHTREIVREDPNRGENSITEKIDKNIDKFRLFVDIDFGAELFETQALPGDNKKLVKYMSDLVRMYDEIVADVYGGDFLCDRIVAVRVPYKIHMIYPSIIANSNNAKQLALLLTKQLQSDERFSKIKDHVKIVDTSVYGTGLRMPGMHKSCMGKKKMMKEKEIHERIFGNHTYLNCYRFVDSNNFEDLPFTLELFKKSSIRVLDPDIDDITAPMQENAFLSQCQSKYKSGSTVLSKFDNNQIIAKIKVSGGSPRMTNTADPGESQKVLVDALSQTIRYLIKQYNHLINEDKIKYMEEQRVEDEKNEQQPAGCLIFPLNTKECHFIGKSHLNNNQYLRIDKDGCRQKCHDCKGEHKVIKPGRFPNNVKEELTRLDVLKADVILKKPKKEVSEEQKMSAVDELVDKVRAYYPKNDLVINKEKVVINDVGLHIGLEDLWCEICQISHDHPCTYLHATETGKMYLKCDFNPTIGLFYPDPPLVIDQSTRALFFANCNVSILSQNIINNNYLDYNTGDVSVDFQEEPIFNDEILNHLIYESLASTTWPISKVIHHLGKHRFSCTKGGEWFVYKNHRWIPNSEGAVIFFVSETVSQYYRQVRDYYKDITESVELRQKRVAFVQKIIDKLTNSNSKTEIMKESRTYFFEEDFYATKEGINFEKRLDMKRNLLCFTNGVYDLDTDEFRDGSPHDFITMCVNYPYRTENNPEQRAIIEKFFVDMQPDPEEREYLLLFLSSMLHGATSEETFHIFTGAAANGKSLLRDMMMYALGDYFESIPANLLTKERPNSSSPQPEIVKLKGKRAVFGSEPEAGQKINTGFMKWITGNDPMQARLCHSNEILEFLPHFKLVLLCNDIPLVDSNDIGTWRRSRIKEFPVMFMDNPRPNNPFEKKIDLTLKSKISECKGEFMLYLMEYFKKFKQMTTLRPTPKILQMVAKHKKKSNTVLQFIEDQTKEAPRHGLLVCDLYPRYIQWMHSELPGEHPAIKSKVIEELAKMRNIEYTKHCSVKGRKGTQQGIRNRRFIDQETDNDEQNDEENALEDGAQQDS